MNPIVNAELERIVLDCLSLNPERRPQSMVDLHCRLSKQCRRQVRIRRLVRARPSLTILVSGAVFICLVCIALYFLFRPTYDARQFARGLVLQQKGEYSAALECFKRAIARSVAPRDAIYQRARTYLLQGDVAAALSDFSNVTKISSDAQTAAYTGYCFSLQGNLSAAIPWYERAQLQGCESAGLHNNLGVCYANGRSEVWGLDRLQIAQSHLEKAIKLDPKSPVVQANLVMVALLRSDEDVSYLPVSSIDCLESLRRTNPDSPRVMADAARIYSLVSSIDPKYLEKAVSALKLSLQHDCGPSVRELMTNRRFDNLRQHEEFSFLLSIASAAPLSLKNDSLDSFIDPVAGD